MARMQNFVGIVVFEEHDENRDQDGIYPDEHLMMKNYSTHCSEFNYGSEYEAIKGTKLDF